MGYKHEFKENNRFKFDCLVLRCFSLMKELNRVLKTLRANIFQYYIFLPFLTTVFFYLVSQE